MIRRNYISIANRFALGAIWGMGFFGSGVRRNTFGADALSASTNKRILCYGDSLTAGTIGFEEPQLFPYSKYLEESLKVIDPNANIAVRHRGFPGWTAEMMVEQKNVEGVGLIEALNKYDGINLVIILAGTNDLGIAFQSDMDEEESIEKIVDSVTALHKLAHDKKVQTLAIAIPESGFQCQVPEAKNLATKINQRLDDWCTHNCDMTAFIEFPFGWKADDSRWSNDGLHFSAEGYFEIAKSIAPVAYMNIRTL